MAQVADTNGNICYPCSAVPPVLFEACSYMVETGMQLQISSKLASAAPPWLGPVNDDHVT